MTIRTISFTLNGQAVTVQAPVAINLLTLLREYMDITSPKFGCAQGNCGACTVLLDGEPVNSCMVLAPTIEGRKVTTVEGVGTPQKPHPLQLAITEHYGAQCGFCTPGMVMSAVDLVRHNADPSEHDVREWLEGNICRCTGYHNIVKAVQAGAKAMRR